MYAIQNLTANKNIFACKINRRHSPSVPKKGVLIPKMGIIKKQREHIFMNRDTNFTNPENILLFLHRHDTYIIASLRIPVILNE